MVMVCGELGPPMGADDLCYFVYWMHAPKLPKELLAGFMA